MFLISSIQKLCVYILTSGIRNAFQLFDKNGDGRITAEELESVIDTLLVPQTATRDDVERMIHQADTDGNGTVEFEEFFRIMHNFLLDNDPDAEVKKAFELFDLDQNVSANTMHV